MYNLYKLEDPILFSSTGRLHYVDSFLFERDWNGVRHSHDISELFFCVNGRGVFSVQDQELPVEPMDFVFIDPRVEHSERSTSSAPLEYVCLGISGIQLLPANRSQGYFHSNCKDIGPEILSMLSSMLGELDSKKTGYEEMCSHIMSILLLHLNRRTTLVSEKRPEAIENGSQMIAWIHQYLTDNFTKEINLDLLADKAGLNKYSIVRNFQKMYGVTPIEYALNLRFDEARFLLRTTDHTILQIAAILGFSSPNYFSQCFQRREGMSPTRYRLLSKKTS